MTHERAASPGPRSFDERLRALHNRRGVCWWSIVFGYPIARVLVVLALPIRAITPTRVTLVGFAAKLGAAVALLSSGTAGLVAAVLLLQTSQVLDSMDGTLARARGQHSALGAFLDKLTDQIGLFAICAAVGVRGFAAGGGPLAGTLAGDAPAAVLAPVLACWGACACALTCYVYWVGRAFAPDVWADAPLDGRAAGPSPAAAETSASALPTWGAIGREWLRGWLRAPLFLEADLYFWIAAGAVAGAWGWLCVGLAVTQTAVLLGFTGYQGVILARR